MANETIIYKEKAEDKILCIQTCPYFTETKNRAKKNLYEETRCVHEYFFEATVGGKTMRIPMKPCDLTVTCIPKTSNEFIVQGSCYKE